MPGYERHIFVCVNERAPTNARGCCKAKGAVAVRDAFKKRITDLGVKSTVRANNAGCLDQCEHGVTVVIYPEQVWYGGVTVEDVGEIVTEHVVAGRFVQRLMLPEQHHLRGAVSGPPLSQSGSDSSRS